VHFEARLLTSTITNLFLFFINLVKLNTASNAISREPKDAAGRRWTRRRTLHRRKPRCLLVGSTSTVATPAASAGPVYPPCIFRSSTVVARPAPAQPAGATCWGGSQCHNSHRSCGGLSAGMDWFKRLACKIRRPQLWDCLGRFCRCQCAPRAKATGNSRSGIPGGIPGNLMTQKFPREFPGILRIAICNFLYKNSAASTLQL